MNTKTSTILIILGIILAIILVIVIVKSKNKTIDTPIEESTPVQLQDIPTDTTNVNAVDETIPANINIPNDVVAPAQPTLPSNPEFPPTGFKGK